MGVKAGRATLAMAVCLALLQACGQDVDSVRMVGIAKHANGLIMPVPEGFEVHEQDFGFAAAQQGMLRSPLTFTLWLQRDGSRAPPPKYLGLFGPQEKISTLEGEGSSGAVHTLEAWRVLGACWLSLEAVVQAEDGMPSFLAARAALAKASVTDAAHCQNG